MNYQLPKKGKKKEVIPASRNLEVKQEMELSEIQIEVALAASEHDLTLKQTKELYFYIKDCFSVPDYPRYSAQEYIKYWLLNVNKTKCEGLDKIDEDIAELQELVACSKAALISFTEHLNFKISIKEDFIKRQKYKLRINRWKKQ